MRHGVAADLEALGVQFTHLVGGEVAGCAEEAGGEKEGCVEAELAEQGRGGDQVGLTAIIESDTNTGIGRVAKSAAHIQATKAGLGWRGKHTLLLQRDAGSWFFLGELYTDLPLPVDRPQSEHCGACRRCIDVCPTGAIVAPYQLDARRCISYLTIEHRGTIPEPLRPLLGNRIYGCDDCQLVCPWNRFAQPSALSDFEPRHGLDRAGLLELFGWTAEEFERRMEGSAIRRIGYERWLRNLAVALGNAAADPAILQALEGRRDHPSALVREHVAWAIAQQMIKRDKAA